MVRRFDKFYILFFKSKEFAEIRSKLGTLWFYDWVKKIR